MSHKRVVKKRGKTYGPYLYESYRDEDGNVKKRYLGRVRGKKRNSFSLVLFFIILFGFLFILYSEGFLPDLFVGNVGLNLDTRYIEGEDLSGNLIIKVNQGELIPSDTKLIVEQPNLFLEFKLSDLIEPNFNGSFFV